MARWPSLAAWRQARRLGIDVTLRAHIAGYRRPNVGGPDPERTAVYGVASDATTLALDIWSVAPCGAPRPAVVKVHGGGWTSGARNDAEAWNRWLNGLGYHVFDIDYRLAPPARWQDAVGDVKAALGWVVEHAADHDVDPRRVSLMGRSAGAQLALLAAYSAGDARLPPSWPGPDVAVRCVVNLFGPSDLARMYHCSPYTQQILSQYIGGSPADHPDRYAVASPLSHVTAAAPPTITVLGCRDDIVTVEQAELLDHALAVAGVAHDTCLLAGSDHGFDVNWGGVGTQVARVRIERFLRQHA